METLAEAIARLVARGFRHDFRATPSGLLAVDTGDTYAPETLEVEELVRFEGSSDPGDESILFALRCGTDGLKGTYAAAYGPSMDPDDAEMIRRLGPVRADPRGASGS